MRMRTIPDLLADAAAEHPDRPWLVSGDKEFTFAETARLAGAAAAGLAGLGVQQGDIVLVVGRNFPAQVFTWLGLARLGAVMLPVNPASTADELVGFLEQVHPALIACDRSLDPTVDEAVARVSTPVSIVDVHESLAASPDDAPLPSIDPRDPVVLIPTSGTTGRSKLVTQTHQGYTLAAEGFPWWVGLTPDD
ncbi:MAG: AMP-binding protein, partial [Acidimicrobiia bacterium]